MEPIRVEVVDDESGNPQARTYAEYKVFSALVRHAPQVRGARVVLRRNTSDHACDIVACAVTVAFEPTGSIRAEGRGPHAFAAVNRTVERLGHILGGRAA